MKNNKQKFVDVIIIGAGISGIGAACHLKKNCPKKSFLILEGRKKMGGTWDLFKYPGIRSDSDMHTFAYKFRPWTFDNTISDGKTILRYLNDTILEFNLENNIKYNNWIDEINWDSSINKWTVFGFDKEKNKKIQYSSKYLMSCTGYYDYKKGYTVKPKNILNSGDSGFTSSPITIALRESASKLKGTPLSK